MKMKTPRNLRERMNWDGSLSGVPLGSQPENYKSNSGAYSRGYRYIGSDKTLLEPLANPKPLGVKTLTSNPLRLVLLVLVWSLDQEHLTR